MAGPSLQFWQSRFIEHATPWDRGAVNPQLDAWLRSGQIRPMAGMAARASGSDDPRVARVLVPGCGSGHEVALLAEWGFDVTAVDYAPAAVERTRSRLRALLQSSRSDRVVRVEVVEADLFAFEPAGAFDAIYEQTCLCAIYPDDWVRYAERLHRWLKPGGRLYALFVQHLRPGAAAGQIEGPPYHCDIHAMRALFPASHWDWPRPPYDRNPHPIGMTELAVVLGRR